MEIEIETGSGPARVKLDEPGNPRFLLVLTHGAGGGVIATGTPEEVAQVDESYTGQFLKKLLDV